ATPYDSIPLANLYTLFSSTVPPPPRSTLFPYTTLFRSHELAATRGWIRRVEAREPVRAAPVTEIHDRNEQPPGGERHRCEHAARSEEHTSELQSRSDLVCRLLLEKKKNGPNQHNYKRCT